MSQSCYFKSRLDPMTFGGVGRAEPKNLGKRLEWRYRDETWWEKISTSSRYKIDITATDPLSWGS